MELEKVKELIELLEVSSLHKLQLKNEEGELTLEKEKTEKTLSPALDDAEVKLVVSQETSNYTSVTVPLVGIYYESSAPDQPPFVEVGSQVKAGDTLCIIEAMKVLNEIKAPIAGEVKAIHAKNGDILSYNQTLIEIGD